MHLVGFITRYQMFLTLFTYHTYLPSYIWLVGLFILTAVHPI